MCIASERLTELENFIKKLKQDKRRQQICLQKSDQELSRLYHTIENTYFDAARGYCLAKQLQNVLHERRKAKDEIDTLLSLITNLENSLDKTDKNVKKVKERIKATRLKNRHYKIAFV